MQFWNVILVMMFYTLGYQPDQGRSHNVYSEKITNLDNNLWNITHNNAVSSQAIYNNETESLLIPNTDKVQEMARSLPAMNKFWSTSKDYFKVPKYRPPLSRSSLQTFPTKPTRRKIKLHIARNSEKNATIQFQKLMKQRLVNLKALIGKKSRPTFSELFAIYNGNPNTALVARNDLEKVKEDYDEDSEEQDENEIDIDGKASKALMPTPEPRTGLVLATVVGLVEAAIILASVVGFGGLLFLGVILFVPFLIKILFMTMIAIYLV